MRRLNAVCRNRWNKRCERTIKAVEMSGKGVAINIIGKTPQRCKVQLDGRHLFQQIKGALWALISAGITRTIECANSAIIARASRLFPRDGSVVALAGRY